jgi:hypothetical protein
MKKVTLTKNEHNHYTKYSDVCKFKSADEEFTWADTQIKECNKCKKNIPLTCFAFSTSGRFPFNKNGVRYRRGDCLECGCKIGKGTTNAKKIAETLGISTKPTKNDKCGFCGCTEKLVFDHDHKKETFRGWLCDPCNRAYGTLESRLGPNWKQIVNDYENK